MASKPKLGNRIAEVRRERDLKQAELARRLGISAPEMSRFENRERTMDRHWLLRIAAVFPCDPWELLPEWGERSLADHIRKLWTHLDEMAQLGLITELSGMGPSSQREAPQQKAPPYHAGSLSTRSVVVMAPTEIEGDGLTGMMRIAEIRHSPDGSCAVDIFAAARPTAGRSDATTDTEREKASASKPSK